MCATCGCGPTDHHHSHDHGHSQGLEQNTGKKIISVEQDILQENNLLAQRNRGFFEGRNILSLNLVSSPGSGKTTLLERTLTDLKGQLEFAVIEGDQQTANDADRIHATGTKVTQINTGKGCHLDAHMVLHAVQGMKLKADSVLFIENVGNLVCPAMFDLGESERVVVISVTEGDDKPLKYPDMFHSSTLCIINKIDLLPYVNFKVEKAKEYARKINPNLEIIELSCTSGEGLATWYDWLKSKVLMPV
ncbi:MAG: hydrogenase accessory protein HypB [Bacteroidetes bacterium 24-39-8]|jgi:hydrogenase nickel incorporation protein HypB|nr:MAG: hydrogenase accessory protein HypB [Sphingobacteriia bacterium 35-40-8]OYZ51911.1 MAG: hydrogenase accessory protein HypB [Bacteroidetes bacterium 24-39-8]OZA64071.1 MAG: hydrogenase accessory protein HypB [Sphingobacteriia bacterium 39-39-8]HQR94274.1 hydrogenase nickel incorporation protein HypB [Sediminibacterium sp.]HQS55155.1 hydrogenase nickel incorporation protein HypB [Sediminibacterium sp.]